MKRKLTHQLVDDFKTTRQTIDYVFDDIVYWYKPFAKSYTNDCNLGISSSDRHIYTNEPSFKAEKLAQVLYSSVMPVSELFFNLTPEDSTLVPWFKDAEALLIKKFQASNLASVAMSCFNDLIFFGNCSIYTTITQDGELSFKAYRPQDTWYICDYNGNPIEYLTESMMRPTEIVKLYGSVCEFTEQDLINDEPLKVYHYFTEDSLDVVLEKDMKVLTTYNFTSPPIATGRWKADDVNVYGFSPCVKGLTDTKVLNAIEKSMLLASQKAVEPPITMPVNPHRDETDLQVDIRPGGLVEYEVNFDGTAPSIPQPLNIVGDISVAQFQTEHIKNRLSENFYEDITALIMQMNTNATATQVALANSEKLQVFLPLAVDILESFVKPIITRSLQLLVDGGELPVPPTENVNFSSAINSPLVQKMREQQTLHLMQTIELVSKLGPQALDHIDIDKVSRGILEQSPIPNSYIRTQDEVENYRHLRAEAMAKQAVIENGTNQ